MSQTAVCDGTYMIVSIAVSTASAGSYCCICLQWCSQPCCANGSSNSSSSGPAQMRLAPLRATPAQSAHYAIDNKAAPYCGHIRPLQQCCIMLLLQAHPQEAQRVVLAMLQRRFLGSLEALGMRPTVHIVQVR